VSQVEEMEPTSRAEQLAARLEADIAELQGLVPELEAQLGHAREDLGKAEVVRRHMARNPERFSPHERENVFEDVQGRAMRQQRLETMLEAAHDRLRLLEELVRELQAGDEEQPRTSALEVYQAVEAERLRIARDLHDGPAQVLSNLVLEAEILERLLRRDPTLLANELQEFKNSVRNAVADMRRFMFELRPISLDDLGLIATMRRLASEYQDRTGIVCRFNVIGTERRLAADVEEALYWIIQEALTNVHRHSKARQVEVNLELQAEAVGLRIVDDGVGFDPRSYHRAGGRRKLGVLGMKERAAVVNGMLQVRSKPGSGTEVIANFSL
jgi:two-component system, NarL family, sensor histidine kinase DegS